MDLAAALKAPGDTLALVVYDARGCAPIAAGPILAVIAVIGDMEQRFKNRVATRVDVGTTRQLAITRSKYKGTAKSTAAANP